MARAVFPLCYLTWDQSMEEVMKIMSTSFKRSHACTAALSAPNPVAGHCLSTSLPETPGHSQASLGQSLVGSLLLYPGSWCTQGFACTPQESFFFPVLCKFWWLYGGINATSFKRAYAIPKSTVPWTSAPVAVHYKPISHRRHSNKFCLSLFGGLWALVCPRFVWALWASLLGMGFHSKHDFAPPTTLWGLLFCLWMWGYLLKVIPPPHSHHSNANHLAGASLSVDEGYLLKVRTSPSFPFSQSLPSGSFLKDKPLILLNQRADRMKITITEN